MQPVNLPEPIAAYFRADSDDPRSVSTCFTNDAQVRDEGQTYDGRAAIQAWKDGSTSRYRYTATPTTLEKSDRSHVVIARVVGDFPGSPVDLCYRFTLERGKIVSLEIGA